MKQEKENNCIKALIVDDSHLARRLLRLMLQEHAPDVQVLAEASNVADALRLLEQETPDVIFLDIEMPGKSGLHLAEQVAEMNLQAAIIFITAYNEYAIRAFRLSAVDYLLKPLNENHLLQAIEKLRTKKKSQIETLQLTELLKNIQSVEDASLAIPVLNGLRFVKVADVLFVKAAGSYAEVHLCNAEAITVSKNLKYFEQALSSFRNFIRVHRSFLINLHQMQRFDKAERGTIVMNDNTEIDLARERRDVFFEALKENKTFWN